LQETFSSTRERKAKRKIVSRKSSWNVKRERIKGSFYATFVPYNNNSWRSALGNLCGGMVIVKLGVKSWSVECLEGESEWKRLLKTFVESFRKSF
jgi:hypothetical protein